MRAIFSWRHLAELNSNRQIKEKINTIELVVIALFEAGFHPHVDV